MSAFVVSREHIHVLIHAGLGLRTTVRWETSAEPTAYNGVRESWSGYRYRELDHQSADAVGQLLLSANVASVNARYEEDDLEELYTYSRPRITTREPVEILKAIACLEYQSCEVEGWEQTEAARCLDALGVAMRNLLPGMSDAAWAIDETTPTLREKRLTAVVNRRA